IAPNDPLVAYFLSAPGAVEIDKLHFESPALQSLRAAGVKMTIPLVSQGELVGLLNLGPRLSEQDYSADDREMLDKLAAQAAPAVRVAQLVREQQAQARARERIEQEMRIARLIQQTLLPKELPTLPGWNVAAYYQPARAVGGDFYDFLALEDGQLGMVIGDVTDKGVPAALVMATTRSILRTAAQGETSPGHVLQQANNLLFPDIPPKMFVTCLYAILDPKTGRIRYANAGHDLPYQRHADGSVTELRARGMPLGLMPDMHYEENETNLEPGDGVLLYSDGLVEAHNADREMFGFPHLMEVLGQHGDESPVIDYLLSQLSSFTGDDWEQEDDVTLVTLKRTAAPQGTSMLTNASPMSADVSKEMGENTNTDTNTNLDTETWNLLDEFTVPSEPGNERLAMKRVAEVVREQGLSARRLEQLKTAVAEATMNAMEHGNHYSPDLPVVVSVRASKEAVAVRITDEGNSPATLPTTDAPDLEAKLAELQTPRGWGLFLIKNLVDEMRVTSDDTHHTVELIVSLEGDGNGSQNA
ncbi:MAG: ATP-binding SpoIIE family protein phosphatase, partial [Ktedonobacterales bacterium]